MAHLWLQQRLAKRFLIGLTLACCLTGGASATAGLRPDPKPPPPQPRPEPPPQTPISPQPPPAQPAATQPPPAQPPPAQPPTVRPAPPQPAPPVVVRTRTRPAGATHRPSESSTREARPIAQIEAARALRERATDRRTAALGPRRAVREVTPLAFSDPQSNVGTVVLLAMLALAAALLLFGFGFTPARAARWPDAARVLEQQGDVLVTTGFAILAASGVFLLLLLTIPN